MQKIIIAAVAENGVIGKNGTMPWHISQELQIFKKITCGAPMIMGRKTFTSLPKMLPGRPHIILTRNQELLNRKSNLEQGSTEKYPPEYVASWQHAFACCEKYTTQSDGRLFIIGGAKVFAEGVWYADVLRLTKVHLNADGDCFFPITEEMIQKEFTETMRQEFPPSQNQKTGFTIVEYHRQ